MHQLDTMAQKDATKSKPDAASGAASGAVSEYDAYINTHFPRTLSLTTLVERLGAVADSDTIGHDKKEYIIFNAVRDLAHMHCIRAIEDPVKRGRLIAEMVTICATSIGQRGESVYYIVSTLLNTKLVEAFDCRRITPVFAKYRRVPADFDSPDGWASQVFVFNALRGTARLPDTTVELLAKCLEILAELYPKNIVLREGTMTDRSIYDTNSVAHS